MTIKQNGGIFGRSPTFNTLDVSTAGSTGTTFGVGTDLTIGGQVFQNTNRITAVKGKVALADNSATTLFTISVENPIGSNDGGVIACRMFLLASFGGSGSEETAQGIASKGQEVAFTIANAANGAVDRSTVTTVYTTGMADPGGNTALTDPVVSLSSGGNYSTDIQVTSNGSGVVSEGHMTGYIELLWHNYLTAPTIS